MSKERKKIGAGIEWADTIEQELSTKLSEFRILELIPENFFFDGHKKFLSQVSKAGTPVLLHAVELSIGAAEPLKQVHLDRIKAIADQVNTIAISDHLCFTDIDGIDIGQLTPLPWNQENCDIVCKKIDEIQSQISVPFQIENITNRFVFPNTELTETQFINQVLRRTGCDLILDLNNVHTNSVNYSYDPYQWIDALDLKSVQGIHLAGGHYDEEGTLVDSHSAPVPESVWNLFRYVIEQTEPESVIVEWTDATPDVATIAKDANKAQSIMEELRLTRDTVDIVGSLSAGVSP